MSGTVLDWKVNPGGAGGELVVTNVIGTFATGDSIGSYSSGDNVIGITGDGKSAFFSINSYSRTTGEDGESLSVFDLNVGKNFSGSGQFFVMSSWEDYNSSGFNFSSSKTHDNINKIIDSKKIHGTSDIEAITVDEVYDLI